MQQLLFVLMRNNDMCIWLQAGTHVLSVHQALPGGLLADYYADYTSAFAPAGVRPPAVTRVDR